MSKKYIEADALLDKIERMWDTHQLTNTKYKTFVDLLNAEPPADVREIVRGEWVYSEKDASWTCGSCGCVFEEIEWKPDYSFCPNCGADMRGDQNETD